MAKRHDHMTNAQIAQRSRQLQEARAREQQQKAQDKKGKK